MEPGQTPPPTPLERPDRAGGELAASVRDGC